MTRAFAGVFGRGADAAGAALHRSLGSDAWAEVGSSSLALAWTGGGRGSGSRTLLLCGRVQNLDALATELGAERELDAGRILLHAFDRWREDMLARVRGRFALVVWDPAERAGLLAVDQLGAGGLFLNESAGRLSFATELDGVAQLLSSRPSPAPASVAQWLADGYLELGDTLLEGIRRLESGHMVKLEEDRWRSARYWAPRYVRPSRRTPAEAGSELQAELMRSVKDRIADTGTTGVLVSGGLDSSTIAAIARKLDPPAQLQAYSLVYPGYPEMDESAMIDELTRALRIPLERMRIDSASALRGSLEYQLAWGLPAATPMFAFNQSLLRRAARDGINVLLDGEGGDELFGCSPYLIADRLCRGNVVGAIALARRVPGIGDNPSLGDVWASIREFGLKGAAPHTVHRTLRRLFGGSYAPPWLRPDCAQLYLETRDEWAWKRRSEPRWWSFLTDLLISWRARMGAHDYFRRRDILAGIESRHPLFDDLDLIELVLRLPPDLTFDPNLSRPLIRAVLEGVLPDRIRLRRDKAHFSQLLIDSLSGPDRPLVAELLERKTAEIWKYARPEMVRDLLATPKNRRSIDWARLVWRLAAIEAWLRSQDDPDYPHRILERGGSTLSDDARAPHRAVTW